MRLSVKRFRVPDVSSGPLVLPEGWTLHSIVVVGFAVYAIATTEVT